MLVATMEEMERAVAELTGGGPTSYLILWVDEGEFSSLNRGTTCGG